MSEFLIEREVKTRKIHNCDGCQILIPRGTKCQFRKGQYDGLFFAEYFHFECVEAWTKLNKGCGPDEWIPLWDGTEIQAHRRVIETMYGVKYA